MAKDFEVTLKLRNNQLKSRRLNLGLSLQEIARGVCVSCTTYCKLENLRVSPVNKKTNDWTSVALKLAVFHGCQPEELFPDSVLRVQKPVTTAEFDLTQLPLSVLSNEPAQLPSPEDAASTGEAVSALMVAINALEPRDRLIITMRFGIGYEHGYTLEEIGAKVGVTRERIRGLETSILKRLKILLAMHNPDTSEAMTDLKNLMSNHIGSESRHQRLERQAKGSSDYWLAEANDSYSRMLRGHTVRECQERAAESARLATTHRDEAERHRDAITNLQIVIDTL